MSAGPPPIYYVSTTCMVACRLFALLMPAVLAQRFAAAAATAKKERLLPQHLRLDDQAMAHALALAGDRPGIVIDVGANNGKQSMMAVRAGRKVVAVECLSSAYIELLQIFRNFSEKAIRIVHVCSLQHNDGVILRAPCDVLFTLRLAAGKNRPYRSFTSPIIPPASSQQTLARSARQRSTTLSFSGSRAALRQRWCCR